MRTVRFFIVVSAMITMFLPVIASANMWSCTHNNMLREVIVQYQGGDAVPCDVVYNKPTEGIDSQVLWSAENEEGYCERMAEGFVAKLESWGWDCAAGVHPGNP